MSKELLTSKKEVLQLYPISELCRRLREIAEGAYPHSLVLQKNSVYGVAADKIERLRAELDWARSCLTAIDQDYVSASAMRKCAQRGLLPKPERLGDETTAKVCPDCGGGHGLHTPECWERQRVNGTRCP